MSPIERQRFEGILSSGLVTDAPWDMVVRQVWRLARSLQAHNGGNPSDLDVNELLDDWRQLYPDG